MGNTDTSKGWLIVGLGFVALGVTFSARAALGLAMPLWEQEFGWSRGLISNGAAMALIVMAIMGPVTGFIVDRHGPRGLLSGGLLLCGLAMFGIAAMTNVWAFVIAYAVIGAIGFGLVSMNAVATAAARQFPDRIGFVSGIATSGSTGGQLLIVPVLAAIIAAWGWRSGYAAMGVACILLAPLVWLAIQSPKVERAAPTDHKAKPVSAWSDMRQVLADPVYLVLLVTFLICGVTTAGVIETHLLPYAAICGFPPLPSATAYGILSAFNLLGMIGAGWLSDRVHRGRLLATIYFARALAFVLLIYVAVDIQLLFVFAVIFGIFDYSTVPVTAGLVAARVGIERMGFAMGILIAGHQVGAAAGAFMGGLLFDMFAQYQTVWLASVGLAAFAGVLALSIRDPVATNYRQA